MIFEGAPDQSCMLQDFNPDYHFFALEVSELSSQLFLKISVG